MKYPSQRLLFLKSILVLLLGFVLASCGPDVPDDVEAVIAGLPEEISYNQHIRPILADRCFPCHGPDQNKLEAGLRLDQESRAKAPLPENPGSYAIVEGKPGHSTLVDRILTGNPELVMPPPDSKLTLSAVEKAMLIAWIDQGAEYQDHWAFIPIAAPNVTNADQHQVWPHNHLDHFVLHRMLKDNLQPSPPAKPELLLRRVYLDLTGLPPTPEAMDAFLADPTEAAYEAVVDRLLASTAHAERLANEWMDVARYADTHGYSVDRYRDMSPWRDWVIDAFFQNMPYNQFVEWQMAGDLLPDATPEQILATGFNRNHPQNMEGGIIPEEFRVEYVSDRTNTMGTAFLGLTLECAKCHDHKYDPISQKEYFQLFAFFNNVNESGQISWDNATPVPTLPLPDSRIDSIVAMLDDAILQQEEKEQQRIGQQQDAALRNDRKPGELPSESDRGLQAHFDFEVLRDDYFTNHLNASERARYINTVSKEVFPPQRSRDRNGWVLELNGDEALDLGQIGVFDRHDPFTIGLWVKIPEGLKDGVIFHKGIGAIIYNWRGFHLAVKDDKLELMMAHTAPNNAIIERTLEPVPRDQWIHLALTYDGAGKAEGLQIYANGKELTTQVVIDNLYRTILFKQKQEAGLKIGARWRGKGLTGGQVDDVKVFRRKLTALEIDVLAGGTYYQKLKNTDPDQWTDAERELMKDLWLQLEDRQHQQYLDQIRKLREERNQWEDQRREIMVMEEMPEPRPSFLLERGQYDAHGERVYPKTPEMLPPMDDTLPRNRLGLVRWMFDERNPLTARVAVNRYWKMIFGQGLVKTVEDFGSQGTLPSHPELLDHLAGYFRDSGWDLRAILKYMVMSSTYRQRSEADQQLLDKDPENRLLARGPSGRLSAEMLRDNALFAAGLLSAEVGGASVKPYQPEGLWRMNGGTYVQDTGKALYRRSLYTFWKRTVPHPTLATFDVPNRSLCTVRRQQTATPLQALLMLNDPAFVETSRAIAEKICQHEDRSEGIVMAFKGLTGREPSAEEVDILQDLQRRQYDIFRNDPVQTDGWLKTGAKPAIKMEPELLASYTVVVSTIMNSDAAMQKR